MSSSSFRATGQPFGGENEDEEEDEEAEEERCRIPRGKDRLTWLIENLAQHFAATKRVYSYVKDACTVKTCPSMTAGPQYEYLWIDEVGYSEPTKLPACKYISRLFSHWCDLILLDHTFGPPQGCEELLGTVFRRLFRVYGHIYYSHLRKIVARRKEAELNRYFKRLVLFSWYHKLIPPTEMEPLQSLINTLLCIKPYCYLATGTGLVAAHAYRRATFTLQAVERNHSAIGSGGDRLTCHIQDVNTGVVCPAHIKDRKDGTYSVTYLPTEPGRFSFHFSSLTKTKVVAEGFKVQVFPSLASDLIKVLSEEQFVDVTFKAGDTRNAIRCHKIIINSRLPGFEILNIIDEIQLSSSVRETTFREFIKYIYTGYVDTRNMKNYMIAELMLMAKNYGLVVLEKALERIENGQDTDGDDQKANHNDDSEMESDDEIEEEQDTVDSDEESDGRNIIGGLGYGSDDNAETSEGTESVDSDYVGRKTQARKSRKDNIRLRRKDRQVDRRHRIINDVSYRDYGSDFEKCINSWKFSDFILSIHVTSPNDGKSIHVRNIYTHKLFLFARSGFFRDLFTVYRDLRKTNIVIREERVLESGNSNNTEIEKSEEKKNFIYVPSYTVFLIFLKWIYTDAVDLHLNQSEHMAKFLERHPVAHQVQNFESDKDEEYLLDELLNMARKFKAVGLIAVLIQHKNQKEKRKREKQRARELASRSISPRSKHKHSALQESFDDNKKKSGGSRKEVIKKFMSSSPSNLSSDRIPTYPYGEMSNSSTTLTVGDLPDKQVTYPYGDMVPSAPSHSVLRMAYDSDEDDAMDLKKANARARMNVNAEHSGSKTASGEYRTGLMRLVASSNTPAPASPSSLQQSPFAMAHMREPTMSTPASVDLNTSTSVTTSAFLSPSPTALPTSAAKKGNTPPTLFSLPTYTPPAFSIPATTIRQGGQRMSADNPSASAIQAVPPLPTSQQQPSEAKSPQPPRTQQFLIPTVVVEEAPPLAPSTVHNTSTSSSSSKAYLAAPLPRSLRQDQRPRMPPQPVPRSTIPSASAESSGYSDLDTEPAMLSSSSPFPPPASYFSPSAVQYAGYTAPSLSSQPYSHTTAIAAAIQPLHQLAHSPTSSLSSSHACSAPAMATTTSSTAPSLRSGDYSPTMQKRPQPKSYSDVISPASATSPPISLPLGQLTTRAVSDKDPPLPSPVTTAGLGSSPSKGSLKSSHSRNHSVPDMVLPSSGGIKTDGASASSSDEVSFLKNGRVTMLTTPERSTSGVKFKLSKNSKKSKSSPMKKSEGDRTDSDPIKSPPSTMKAKELEISHEGSSASTSANYYALEDEVKAPDQDFEDESCGEDEDSSDASGSSSHRRQPSRIVRADVAEAAQQVISKSKQNWRDSL